MKVLIMILVANKIVHKQKRRRDIQNNCHFLKNNHFMIRVQFLIWYQILIEVKKLRILIIERVILKNRENVIQHFIHNLNKENF